MGEELTKLLFRAASDGHALDSRADVVRLADFLSNKGVIVQNGRPLEEFLHPIDAYKGLKEKYLVFEADTGKKVENCFVLCPGTDPVAVTALRAYASETGNYVLAADIYNWVGTPWAKADSVRAMRDGDLASALTRLCMTMVQNILTAQGVNLTATEVYALSEQVLNRYQTALRSPIDQNTDMGFWGVVIAGEAYNTAFDVAENKGLVMDLGKINSGLLEED